MPRTDRIERIAKRMLSEEAEFRRRKSAVAEEARLLAHKHIRAGNAARARLYFWRALTLRPTLAAFAGLALSLLGSRAYRAVHRLLK